MPDIRDELIIHQRENEVHFLASAFNMPEIVLQECGWLRPDMLISPDIASFWKALIEYRDPMRAANVTGMMSNILGASANTPNLFYYAEFARAIAEDYFLINVLGKLGTIATNVSNHNIPEIFAALEELRVMNIPGYTAGMNAENASNTFDVLVDRIANGDKLAVMSGIPALDLEIGGFFRGELTTLAARPSVGKTALLLQIARNVSINGMALFFSMEMSADQIWARMACSYAGYSWTDVRVGNVDKAGLRTIKMASAELRSKYAKNLIIVDNAYTTSDVHQISAQYKPSMVLIDQLGDFIWHDPAESVVSWYGKVMKYLKHYIARGMDIPVIINHHINRAVEGREDKHPQLSDLRYSGDIEQKSDVVLLMYRRDQYDGRGPEQYDVPAEVKVAKNRQGEAGGVAVLNYNLKEQWFS